MSRYRRAQVRGATYFFTVNLLNRRSDLLVRHIDLLRKTVSHPLTPPFTCRAIPSAASRNLHHRRYNLA